MKITKSEIDETNINVLTTEKVNEIIEKKERGLKMALHEKIWFDNKFGVRKEGVRFAMTKMEVEEYTKCKMSVQYFADHYCHIKREDGTVGPMTVRDYQKDIIDLYVNSKYSILMASRQTGKTVSAAIVILHFVLFNDDKNVMIVANKGTTVVEILDKIKGIYVLLPFFLKKGVVVWNQLSMTFERNTKIKTDKRTKEPAIGFTIDLLYLDEFAHIPNNIIEHYYTAVVPLISAVENAKMIITSTPNGLNLFHKLIIGAELPEDDPNWNGFHSLRVYWWMIKGRRDTKIFLSERKLNNFNITEEEIRNFLSEQGYITYDKREEDKNGIFIKFKTDDDRTTIEYIRNLRYKEYPLSELGVIVNWQEQQIKLFDGEDKFKQEFDLQFLTANRLLFDSVTMEKFMEDKHKFSYYDIPIFNKKMTIPYTGLQFVKNQPSLFNLDELRKYYVYMSIDLSEGLGSDYSIINIFRLLPKNADEINIYKRKIVDIYDYFKLEQIGFFRTNIYSVKEIAQILYLLSFEFFDPDKVKVTLERNTYGDEMLAHMPYVFNENNNYSNHIFVRYKQRIEDKNTKMGIKINRNKNILIKEYQTNTKKGNIVVHDQYTITEISTFTKHDTPGGDTTYKSESGHDDAVMTCVTLSSIFGTKTYKDSIDELMKMYPSAISRELNDAIRGIEEEKPDFSSILGGYKKVYGAKPVYPGQNPSLPMKPMPNSMGGSYGQKPRLGQYDKFRSLNNR